MREPGARGAEPAAYAPAPQSRPRAGEAPPPGSAPGPGGGSPGAAGAWPGVRRPPFPHVARHVAERPALGALEPPASVAAAVSSLTVADAFVRAGESPAPPRPALPRRFICSFPDCSASYNKAWKLDAHLCKHTGEVKVRRRGRGTGRPGPGTGDMARPVGPRAWPGSAGRVQRWHVGRRSESPLP